MNPEMTEPGPDEAALQRDGTSFGLVVGDAGGVVTPDDLERIARTAREFGVPLVKVTNGQRIALLGIAKADLPRVASALEARFGGREFPSKVKMCVSGCNRNCGMCFARDLGFMGTDRGWTVFFGGNGGRRPRTADVVASNLTPDQALELAARLLEYYGTNAWAGERTARFVERIGLEAIRNDVLRFIPYLPLDGA